jgi:two-component system sensor histidine kinase KdpD
MEIKPLALNAWLHGLIEHNHHLLLQAVVQWELDPNITNIQADEYHLGIALTNLLDNAVKYAPAHSTLTVSTRHKPGWVGVAVKDQGPGIPPDMQNPIFGEYYRLEPESHIRGVGLGLSIVQQIARAHGGSVEVNSTPGQGATFCIWIPQ